MTRTALTGAARALAVTILASAVFGLVFFGLVRLWPHRDMTPVVVARQDEKTAATAAQAVGQAVQAQNDDATLHIDLTTKDIRDAFDALPAPQPAAGNGPRSLPAAPVDGMRDRLNESIARANRAARSAGEAD